MYKRIMLVVFGLSMLACETIEFQKESWERSKNPDGKAEWVLTSYTADVALEDLNALSACLKQTIGSSEVQVTGSYVVNDGYHYIKEILATEQSKIDNFDRCAKTLLVKEKRNVANGIRYQAYMKAREFHFTFKATVFPSIAGEVVSSKYKFKEKIK